MQSARSLLVHQGIENFTVAQVAAVASVSKPAVYYYFDSKEDPVCELSFEVLTAEHQRLERAVGDAESEIDALVRLVRTRIDFYMEDRDSFRILHVWGPVLGLQPRIEASPQYAALRVLLSKVGERLNEVKNPNRAPTRVDVSKLPELGWALSQGIIAAMAVGPAREGDSLKAQELRDSACRWLLDSLVD
ncbi:MAG: TetR/AcrR family transcriptional regulator [Polyangiaceae bacterium]